MTPSTELFDLIKSMSKSEKRLFKVDGSKDGKDRQFLLLFNAVEKMKHYDEASLKRDFDGEPFLKNLAMSKRYLKERIMNCLRRFGNYPIDRLKVAEVLANVRIFKEKGLVAQAFKEIRRLQKQLRKEESFAYLHLALNVEYVLLTSAMDPKQNLRLLEVQEDQHFVLKTLNVAQTIRSVYSKLLVLEQQNRVARTIEQIVEAKGILDLLNNISAEHLPSYIARWDFFNCHSQYYAYIGSPIQALPFNRKLLKLFRTRDEKFQQENFSHHLGMVQNYLSACLGGREFIDFQEQLNFLKSHAVDHKYARQLWILYALYYFNNSGNFSEGCKLVKEELSSNAFGWDMFYSFLRPHLFTQIAYAYFGNSEFETAIDWIERIKQTRTEQEDLYFFAHIVQVICHYELGNMQLIESLYRSVYRSLKKAERIHGLEQVLLKIFRESLKAKDRAELLKVFRTSVRPLASLRSSPKTWSNFYFIDYAAWAESKAEGLSFQNCVKEKFRENVSKTHDL